MSNWKHLVGGVAMTALTAAYVQVAEAQVTTSSVEGRVTNESGAPIRGATVTIRNAETGFTRSTQTSGSGSFTIRNLPVGGDYVIETSSDGYRSSRIENIGLALGEATDLDFSLEAADSTMTMDAIVITAESFGAVEVAAGPSASFNLDTLQSAPTVNRNIVDVLRIDPRVYVDESRGDINPIQCAGKNPRFNSLTLDGVRLNDGFGLNSNGYPTERQPFPFDAIEAVAVELAPFDVEYGGFTACNINAVTKSGTNEFHGSAFYDYTSDELRGDTLEGDDINRAAYDEVQYGFQVAGPIVKDTLFFSVAYEKLEGANTFGRGPIGSGSLNEVNITQAELDDIVSIANTLYQYDPGTIPSSFDNEDEKLLVKLDWNINDQHRAAFTYNYNDGFNFTQSDGDLNEFEFSNHLYERGSELNQYVGFLYSDWTSNFSTELRLGRVELDNRQISVGGTDFGEIRIETDDVDVYIGGDDSRQSNKLNYEILNFAAKGFLTVADHNMTFGYERDMYDIFNLFVQHTETEIRFDGIENFRNGFADAIYYNNAPTSNPQDAAADWGYAIDTLYAQDEWQVTNNIKLLAGLRYDMWSTDDAPAENAAFVTDYGFSNSQTLDGASLLQPRLAITYDVLENVTLRGGIGIYSGGDPNVWLSNTYSANNVLQFGQRGRSFGYTDGTRSLFDDDIVYELCEDGVPAGPGYCVPSELVAAVEGGVGDNFELNYLDPDFDIPSEIKASLGATLTPTILGGDYVIGLDLLYSQGKDSAIVKRGDLVAVGQTAEGYPQYSSVREASFVLTNSSKDTEALTASISVTRDHGNGFDWSFGYAYSDAKDVQPMTSSVAFSNYVNRAFFDPQEEVLSTSNYNITHRFTAFANYEHAFFGDYLSKVSAVGLLNSGRPYSIGFNGTINPYGFTPFLDFQDNVLRPGASRNDQDGSWWGKVDLSFSQELPGIREDHRTKLYLDIDNFTNLLNDEWGVLREANFPLTVGEGDQAEARVGDASTYEIRLGIRYEF